MSYQINEIKNLKIVGGDIRSRFTIEPEDGQPFDVMADWDPASCYVEIVESPGLEDEEIQGVEDAIYFFLFDPEFDLS